jgi:inner membrane protein
MASAISHAIVAVTMGQSFQNKELGWRELLLGALCSVLPDLDVIGFHFGIQYGDLWGHRGLTHSLLFAGVLSGAFVALWHQYKPVADMTGLFVYFSFCTASHGVLDAMTNGGLGVAFLSPFDTTRYFLPLRPILVSPIEVSEFFTVYGLRVLASEAIWIWLPSCAAVTVLRAIQRIGRPS